MIQSIESSRDAPPAGLLLVGHGTRSSAGRSEFQQTAELVRGALAERSVECSPRMPVVACYLELAEPTIGEGLTKLIEQGVRQVIVAPLLLFAAGHAKRDIPLAVAEAAQRWPDLSIAHLPAFGCQEEIVELSVLRFREACINLTKPELGRTALVVAGRGSHDSQATAELHRFAGLVAQRCSAGKARACFLALALPTLETVLSETAAEGWPRIVVQPHLLFRGELVDQVIAQTAAARNAWPDSEWLVPGHLGPAPLLAQAILARLVKLGSYFSTVPLAVGREFEIE